MRHGLLSAIQLLKTLKDISPRSTLSDGIEIIERRLDEHSKTIEWFKLANGKTLAIRGNFNNFSDSPYGVGYNENEATADLLKKEVI